MYNAQSQHLIAYKWAALYFAKAMVIEASSFSLIGAGQRSLAAAEYETGGIGAGWQFNRLFDRLNHGLNHFTVLGDDLGHDLGGQITY